MILLGILIHIPHTNILINPGEFLKISTYNIVLGYRNNAIDKCNAEIMYMRFTLANARNLSNQCYIVFGVTSVT